MLHRFFYIFLLFLVPILVAAQHSNERCKWLTSFNGEFELDTLSVVPGSITITDVDNDTIRGFQYNLTEGTLSIGPVGNRDSLWVCYKVFPYRLHQRYYRRNLSVYDSNALFHDNRARYNKSLIEKREELFSTEDINKTGSISRGISFGNRQDVFVNSMLNLQLEGKLTEEINIRAAISDQNIPFQPEGNTQQLQEFDKVFIQLYNDNASITAGDVVLKNKPSEFLRFNKNVQGGHLETHYNAFENSKAVTSASISVAKGKFASIQVDVLEGVQGPYRLRGPNNEKFIIVLANSEKVFIDGQLLQRGYNYDYTIDYNRGEITFTNRVVITKFSRIRVDFEFSDRNYSRAILSGSHYQDMGKLNIFTNYYSEKDNRNRPLTFDLSNDEKLFLSKLGDDPDAAVISGADSVEFNPNQVLYKKTDTAGFEGKIFVFSTNPDSAVYDVIFSEVGKGKGNYIEKKPSTANGKVFVWVAPENGIPRGNYEPVISIPTPAKKQMFTAGAGYKVGKFGKVFTEMAISDNDINLFSDLDGQDNKGHALKAGYRTDGYPLGFLHGYKLKANVDYEFNDKYFQAIDRFRHIEFDRNWNFVPNDENEKFDDHILTASAGVEKDGNNRFNYRVVKRKRGEMVDGVQQYLTLAKSLERFRLQGDFFTLDNEQKDVSSDWMKMDVGTSYHSKIFVPGYVYSWEKNKITFNETDSVIGKLPGLPIPLNYSAHTFYLKSNDSLQTQFKLDYSIREDQSPRSGELVKSNRSQTTNFSVDTRIKENHNLSVLFTYRAIENLDQEDVPALEETIMGRVDWLGNLLDNHIKSEFSYSISNGRELRREFVFLKVPAGEGTHTWRDENGDDVQDLNEFYEAINPDERNYAKIFTPTDEYILAFTNMLNYSLELDMPRNWQGVSGLKGFMAMFSNSTYWSIDKKQTNDELAERFLPFKEVDEGQLLSIRESLRSTLFFNRSNPKFGLDGGILMNERKELLTNGFETRKKESYHLNSRLNIQRLYNIRLNSEKSTLANGSDFLIGRNYKINAYKLGPELEWQPLGNFRLTAGFIFTDKKNELNKGEDNEYARIEEFSLEARLNKVSKSTFNAKLNYFRIDFEGDENTALGYELLQALRPGDNITWSINFQQKIVSGLQLNLSYEGRKSPERDVIHTGRMQVSALF